MASPLLASMDARIAAAQHPLDAVCLRAERAGLLARQGDLDEARAELAALHALHERDRHPLVSAWLHLADGLVLHFTNHSAAARDRMLRSLALGTAIGSRPVQALSAAWLAQIEYLRESFELAAKALARSFDVADSADNAARGRACLVSAQCLHWANRFDAALLWYQRTRIHSTASGDQALIGALMHNMTWLRVAQARHASVVGGTRNEEVKQILCGAESLQHFDTMTGMAPLASLVPVLRAHVLTLLGRYEEARELFLEYMQPASEHGLVRMFAPAMVDLAWCRINTGDPIGAGVDALTVEENVDATLHVDERAFVHGRLVQIYEKLNLKEKEEKQRQLANVAAQAHLERQRQLYELVSGVCSGGAAW